MNALNLHWNASLIWVSSLCLGLPGIARGQTSSTPPPNLEAALAARRQALDMQAPSRATETSTPTATGDIPALRVAVSSINESRNSQGRGSLNLTLSISGEGLPPGAVVKQITVTKAVDNLDRVLGSSSMAAMPASISMSRMMSTLSSGRGGAGPLTGQASLEASARKAESLKYAEGVIELFLPSEANGSLVRIPNILSHGGRIEDPALAKHGIEFYIFPDQASYDEGKNIAGFQTRAQSPSFPNGVGYFVRDPSGRLAGQQFQEATGAMVRLSGTSSSGSNGGQTGAIRLMAPLPADAQLVIYIASPEATKTVPFRVEDITLP